MGLLEDIMKTLERVPAWKRMVALTEQVDKLEKRVADLEAKLGPKPGEECPKCGERSLKLISSAPHPDFGFAGVKLDQIKCTECSYEESRDRETARK